MNEAEPVAKQIHIAPLIHIPQPGSVGALDHHRIWRVKAGRSGIAARQRPGGPRHQCRRGGRFAPIAFFDEAGRVQEGTATAAIASTSSFAPSSRSFTPTVALAGQGSPNTSVRTLAYTG